MLKTGALGCQLVTYHNLAYMLHLMRGMRQVGSGVVLCCWWP
jgi:queuine/archaeosine tRNA-ribosyltransferase